MVKTDRLSQAILDFLPDTYFILDAEGTFLEYKPEESFTSLLPPEDFLGRKIDETMPADVAAGALECIQTVLKTGETQTYRYGLSMDGGSHYFEARFMPFGEDTLAIVRDVTDHVKASEELARSEDRYRRLFENNPTPMYIYDTDTLRIVSTNSAMCHHYGYTMEELKDMTLLQIRPEDDAEEVRKEVSGIRSRGIYQISRNHLKKDGSLINVEITSIDFLFDDRKARLVLCHDVTEKLQTETALRETLDHLKTLYDASPDMIFLFGEDHQLLEVNQAVLDKYGFDSFEEFVKMPREDFVGGDHSAKEAGRLVMEAMEGKDNEFLWLTRKPDGTEVPLEVHLKGLDLPASGGEKQRGVIAVARDVTERKKAEERLRESLREKEVLLQEIHHRVKNNLQVISGLLDLQAHHITDRKGREVYKESQNRIITMALIHEELYQASELSHVDFATYIQSLVANLFVSYGVGDRIDLKLKTETIDMVVDTAIPCAILANELITNAIIHAFPGDERGNISVGFRSVDKETYELTISNNGRPFPEDLDFRKTNTLGLQLVNILTEQLGGTVELDTAEGTTFRITFREYVEAGIELH